MVSESIERLDFSLFLGDLVNNGMMARDWEDWYAYGEKFISNNLAICIFSQAILHLRLSCR